MKTHTLEAGQFISPWKEMMWTAGIQMKWVCDHRSESQFKQLRESPKKRISGFKGFEPVASALALQCSTSLSYEDPYTRGRPIYWVYWVFHSVFHSFHGLINSINWPASSVLVFIAQAGRALSSANAEATGPNPVEAPKSFFSGFLAIAWIAIHCDGHILISFVFAQFTSFHAVQSIIVITVETLYNGHLWNEFSCRCKEVVIMGRFNFQ